MNTQSAGAHAPRARKPRPIVRLAGGAASIPSQTPGDTAPRGYPKTDARHWKQQLIQRAHGQPARPRPFQEFSARIEHEGTSHYFPLDSDSREAASDRALEIYQAVLAEGWPSVLRRHPREFTLAIFWSENPMVFTYCTLYSAVGTTAIPTSRPPRALNRSPRLAVAIVEPDGGCRRALAEWVRALPTYSCRGLYATSAEALLALPRRPVNLVLFNRQVPGLIDDQPLQAPGNVTQSVPVISYRIYDSSDDLFVSQPGVSGGYYFRRRTPENLLEPIQTFWQDRSAASGTWLAHIHGYVQKLFLYPPDQAEAPGYPTLTSREHDTLDCLRRGNTDKEIARALNISLWTVHTHLKKIYAKLGVRSRTEAVIKYVQK